MTTKTAVRTAAGYLAGGAALAALGYAAFAGAAWTRYGHATRARHPEDEDPLLDRFMPLYDIVERHHVRVAAPASVTQAAAREMQLRDSCVVRAIFKGRELMLGRRSGRRRPDAAPEPGSRTASRPAADGALARVGRAGGRTAAAKSCSAPSRSPGSRLRCSAT